MSPESRKPPPEKSPGQKSPGQKSLGNESSDEADKQSSGGAGKKKPRKKKPAKRKPGKKKPRKKESTGPDTKATPPLRQLIVAASAARRLDRARTWLGAPGHRGALIVGPSRGAADDLLASVPGAGLFDVHSRTLPQLASELAIPALASRGWLPIRELATNALAARAITLAESGDASLEYLHPVAEAPGLPRALCRTLAELRAFGVDPDHLDQLGPGGRDLATLGRTFESLLEEGGFVDWVRLLGLATEMARKGPSGHPSGHLLARPLLILDLSPDSPLEGDLLRAVVESSPDVLALALEGDDDGIGRLAEALALPPTTLDAPEPPTEPHIADESSRLSLARRRLFVSSEPETRTDDESAAASVSANPAHRPGEGESAGDGSEGDAARDESLIFFSAPGEDRECVEIARHLHALASAGIAFDACAVALRQPEIYAPLLEEAFARAHIPAHFSRGSRRPDPAGRAFLTLLACAEEDLSAVRFAEYLSLDAFPIEEENPEAPTADGSASTDRAELVPWVEPEGDQMVFASLLPLPGVPGTEPVESTGDENRASLPTPRHWEQLIGEAGVQGGRSRWRSRLDGMRAEVRLRLEASGPKHSAERTRLRSELARVDALAAFALPLIDRLAELPRSADWGRWIEPLESLAVRALGRPERVLRMLEELRPMSEVGPVGLGEVRRVLDSRLIDLRSEPVGRRFGRVWVAGIDELRGRSFHTVFLPGLAEGSFPRRAYEDPLLLDQDRLLLEDHPGDPAASDSDSESPSGHGGTSALRGLPTLDERVERERRLLRIAVGAAEERLVVSYPNLDTRMNRGRVPSFYALDLLRAAEGRLPDLRLLERRAAEASPARLGWPAPRDPSLAIDETEFDLSTLVALLGSEPGEDRKGAQGEGRDAARIRGRGRYLLETNPYLGRSLRHRYRRYSLPTINAADGLITRDPTVLSILARHRLGERAFETDQIETFAACPYRFYLRAVLGLQPRDPFRPVEQMAAATRERLFREILGCLAADLAAARAESPPVTEKAEALFLRADRLLDLAAAHYADELIPTLPRLWQSEIESLRMDLRGFLRARLRTPRHPGAEKGEDHFAFDLLAEDGSPVPILGRFRFHGTIDLVEQISMPSRPASDGAGTEGICTTDYETRPPAGSPSPLSTVAGGEMLRPLAKALAAEARLERTALVGNLAFCTRRAGYRQIEVRVDERGRKALCQVLDTVDDAICRGFLPSAPRQGACASCDFRKVCGPAEEARMAAKNPAPLDALERTRRLP